MSAKSYSGATLLNASVDGLGDVVTLYFDQKLDAGNIPSASQFSVVNGSAHKVTGVEVLGKQVILTLDSPLDAEAPVTLSYTDLSLKNDAVTLQNQNGTDVASFRDFEVTDRLSLTEAGEGSFAYAATISLDGAEISAFDATSGRLFVTSSSGLQVVAVNEKLEMRLLGVISLGDNDITSVAVKNGIVAVSVAADDKTEPGSVYFLDADGSVTAAETVLGSVEVGALPDMLTFSADGKTVLVANEGEQDTEGNNPEGSVSIIDISSGVASATVRTASFASFNDDLASLKASGVRLFAGEAGFEDVSVSQDLEPEYISISPDGKTAFITLQENNAVAVLDMQSGEFTGIVPLGLKSFASLPFDGSDKDGIDLQTGRNVYGQYMPDAIASFTGADGETYYVIANEGDDRDDFLETAETARVKDLDLDNSAYPDEIALKSSAELGRLTVSNAPGNNGDTDGDGDIDQLLAYGGRSFSILDENGTVVFDSGSHIEQYIAANGLYSGADGEGLFDDSRSDNKSAEPEGVTVAQVDGKTLAFIGLERGGGGVMVYDVTDPSSVEFVQYLRNAGDESPEGLTFVSETESPSGQGLLFVTNEVSGTVTIYRTNEAPEVAEEIADMSVVAGAELHETLLTDIFSDADSGDSLTYSAAMADGSVLPEWLGFIASHHDIEDMEDYFLPAGNPANGSGSGPATDSASAGTAIATGVKTVDGNIAWERTDSAGGEIETIAETLRDDMGYAIGVASTVAFSHATPATFVSHDVNRNNYWDIAHEILLEIEPEVVIGAGYESSYFAKATTNAAKQDTDLDNNGYNDDYDAFVNGTDGTSYLFVERETGVDGGDLLAEAASGVDLSAGEKLFGLFGTSGGNFEYYEVADSPGSPSITRSTGDATPAVDEDPTLAEVTLSSLSVLNQDEDGFFIMIEQGDIDWSNHANDYENMVGGVYDLDQAVRAAEAYVETGSNGIDWSNTLVIVTSDHSNSYMRAQEELGIGDLPAQNGKTYPDGEVTYGTGGHSNELVTVSAKGAGAELFEEYAGDIYEGTNIVDNTQIYEVMMQAAKEAGAEHVILFIGDGMNIEHEIAASRYLYGTDFGLAWQNWNEDEDGWSGYASTWDVTTYNKYAAEAGVAAYSEETYDPLIGYDPSQGGATPYPVEMTLEGTPTAADAGVYEIEVTATDEAGASVSDIFMLTVTNSNYGETEGDDRLAGKGSDDVIYGAGGNDRLTGNNGNDILVGGTGNDTMQGGKGDDTYYVDSQGDVVSEGLFSVCTSGTDTVISTVDWTLGVNVENLVLKGTDDIDGTGNCLDNELVGNEGDNILTGHLGDDILDGGAGDDTMLGGKGDDTYYVDSQGDVVRELFWFGTDTVISTIDWTLGANVENLEFSADEAIDGTGNSLGNRITGNAGDNLLSGLGGSDTLFGAEGNDTLLGGDGNDVLFGGAGVDLLTGGCGNDTFRFMTAGDSGLDAETMDVISDFSSRHDRLDLSGIDANSSRSGDQAFSRRILCGSDDFTAAGQLRFDSAEGILYGNTDGDVDAEFAIQLSGVNTLLSSDIVL